MDVLWSKVPWHQEECNILKSTELVLKKWKELVIWNPPSLIHHFRELDSDVYMASAQHEA